MRRAHTDHLNRLVLPLVAGLVLAACSDTAADDPDQASALEPYLGTAVRLNYVEGSVETGVTTGKDIENANKTAQLIKECMNDLGFEYLAVESEPEWQLERQQARSLPPREFADQYGYGISTMPEPEEERVNPNAEIKANLSDEGREEWERALQGVLWDGNNGEDPAMPPASDLGCVGAASVEAGQMNEDGTHSEIAAMDEFEGITQDLISLIRRVKADPDVQAAEDTWAACMADAGYADFRTVSAPIDYLHRRHEKVGTDSPVPTDLAELQQEELEIASADYACREEHYAGTFERVRHEHEAEFADDHRAELEHYRDFLLEQYGDAATAIPTP